MTVSIVVLTYNGGDLLARVVDRLLEQRVPEELEVVLVDSGSNDGSERLANERCQSVSIGTGEFGFGYARDLGFDAARGDYIATISQDYLPSDKNWLDSLVDPLRNGADVTMGAANAWPDRRPFYWETRQFWWTREGRRFQHEYGGRNFSCVALATRRQVWRESGGFGRDTPMSEDKYFQRATFEAGFRDVIYVPEATGWHGHTYNLKSLAKRCENEGFGWKWLGEQYRTLDFALDLVNLKTYAKLGMGLLQGRVRTPAELLFPWVRPISVYRGNRWNNEWKR